MFKHLLSRAVLTTAALLAATTAHPAYSANPAATTPTAFTVSVTGTGAGAGAPVILIPGLASSGAVWDGTVQRFCAQRQCHVLTLAGFAGTPAVDAPLLPAVEQQRGRLVVEALPALGATSSCTTILNGCMLASTNF